MHVHLYACSVIQCVPQEMQYIFSTRLIIQEDHTEPNQLHSYTTTLYTQSGMDIDCSNRNG